MKKKIIGILVCMLLIATALPPVSSTDQNDVNLLSNEINNDECGCNRYNEIDNKFGGGLFPECPIMSNPSAYYNLKESLKHTSSKPIIEYLPDEFSWKDYNGLDWTTPVKNQGDCGSCWDFAAIGMLESVINIKEGFSTLDPDLSEQYVLSCLPEAGSCHGGSLFGALWYMMETTPEGNYHNGAIPESCFPYQANDNVPCDDKCNEWEDLLVPILNCGWFYPDKSSEDIDVIKTELMEKGPLGTIMAVDDDFIEWIRTHHDPEDYYSYRPPSDWPNHCVILVGWKDDPLISNGGYWIVKNSWGSFSGYDGFFNIEYKSLFIDTFEITWVDYDPDSFDWAPVADAGGPYYGDVGQEIVFDASGSFDPESDIISYYWDFGDGTNDTEVVTNHAYLKRGLYEVTLTVFDESGKHSTDETVALVDIWLSGDSWTYNIDDVSINLDLNGRSISLHGSSDELLFTVADDSGDSYQLDFKGKITGDFEASLNTGSPNFDLSGRLLKLTTMDGNVIFRQSDLGIKEVNICIKGIVLLYVNNIRIPLPIPFRITLEVHFDTVYTFLDFPLTVGKEGSLPLTKISIDAFVGGIFGFLKKPFGYDFILGALPYVCLSEDEITVEAGTFNAYEISIPEAINYYYAPEAGNIIKISAELDDYFTLHGELKSTNYEQ